MAEGISLRTDGGFTVHEKEDGTGYWRLVKACIDEGVDQDALIRNYPAKPDFPVARGGVETVLKPIVYTNPKRMVFHLEWGGRTFILKRAYMGTVGLRRLFPNSTGLTYFTRVMKLVDAARRNGCGSTQACYCVAERWLSPFRQEVWVLLEYIEGGMFRLIDLQPKKAALVAAAEDLLRHGLTMDDVALGNFLLSGEAGEEKVRAIDISCRVPAGLHAAKMRMKLNTLYGLGLPLRGGWARALGAQYWLRKALGFSGIEEK